MQICPKCHTNVPDSKADCNNCGMYMSKTLCSSCTSEISIIETVCEFCGNYINREYFIVTSSSIVNEQLINNRYLVLDETENLVKDTLPNHQTFRSEPVKDSKLYDLYQKLSKHHSIPRVYDSFLQEDNDYIVISTNKDSYGQNLRGIREAIIDITERERLQILRDMSALFNLLQKERVASSIIDISNLFIDENINIKIKKITLDTDEEISLKNLGEVWRKLLIPSSMSFLEYSKYKVGEIIKSLLDEKLTSSEELEKKLDSLLEKNFTDLDYYSDTNAGRKRSNNEDNFYSTTVSLYEKGINKTYTGKRGLFIVCDGMGGHESGEIASFMAVSEIRNAILPAMSYHIGFEEVKKIFEDAIITKANEEIFQLNEKQNRKLEQRMGTTVVICLVFDNRVYTAHVGDSRIYLVSKNDIQQLTQDHNVAMKNYHDGIGSWEDAARNASTVWGKVLTQALGIKSKDTIEPEINAFEVKEESYILLCSDGLTDMVNPEDIRDIIHKNWTNSKAVVNSLIESANNNGGRDNITATAVCIKLLPSVFPPADYAEIFYNSEVQMSDEIIEMFEMHEKALDGIDIEPDATL